MNRRGFIRRLVGAAAVIPFVPACDFESNNDAPPPALEDNGPDPPSANATPAGAGVLAYRLSVRRNRASNAAKLHAANKVFATAAAAKAGRAHPRDSSRVVSIVVTRAKYDFWFRGGDVIDLRHFPLAPIGPLPE